MQALVEPLEHLLRGLHRRPGLRDELSSPVFAPVADQLACHLDVTLHPEVLPEHKRLIRAIRTPGDARRLRWDGEGLAVPVKTGELPRRAEPLARLSVVFDRDRAPADFLYPVTRHPASERLGDELSAEAVAEHRDIGVDRLVDETEHLGYPRKDIVHAHRPTHECEPRERARIRGNLLPCVDLDEPVRNAVRVEECGKIARPLGAAMAKNRNRFHVRGKDMVVNRIVASLLVLLPAAGWTAEVSVIGLFPGKAVVVIDGGAPRV